MARDFDLIVYGATGFTGRLVAEYLAARGDVGRWGIAGRSAAKLEEVACGLGSAAPLPHLIADAANPASLDALAKRSSVVLTTVGPYQLYGSELVAACARSGTDYVDLCGEPAWMREMIDRHSATVEASGARIVFSCGFDSIPFDLGVLRLQQIVKAETGRPASRIKGRVRSMKGTFSGGTAASMKATMAAAARDMSVVSLLKDPFALTPGFKGARQPLGLVPEFDEAEGKWAAPFVMAPINTKNVHRTNLLLGEPYGRDFQYDEMVLTTLGDAGRSAAQTLARLNPFADSKGPEPGEGPSKEEREAGHYEIVFTAEGPDDKTRKLVVKGDRDPGYGSTSKMIAEAAILLADTESKGGIWTPGALLGDRLIERLEARAGLSFVRET